MKKLISMLLTIAMLMSFMPTISFAENDVAITEATEQQTELTTEEEQYIGNTVHIGNDMYSLQECEVYVSKNYGRDTKFADGEITWLVEDNGFVYWSKLGEHNTTDIVKYDPATGEESVFTHLFVPVEAFDVAGDDIYYLYNGEIVKNNVTNANEEIVMVDKNVNAFYLNNKNIIIPNKDNSPKGMHSETENSSVELFGTAKSTARSEQLSEFDNVLIIDENSGWYWPVDNECKVVYSEFGDWKTSENPNGHHSNPHQGIDIPIAYDNVYAARDGIVYKTGWDDSGGNYVSIYHGQNTDGKKIFTTYMHLSDFKVKAGERVFGKQSPIATSGDTGPSSTGPHLHFQIYRSADNTYTLKHKDWEQLRENYINSNPSRTNGMTWNGHQNRLETYNEGWAKYNITYLFEKCDYCKKPSKTQFKTVDTSKGKYFGICKTCSQEYNYRPSLDESVAGYYTLNPNKSKTKITMRALPYDGSGVLGNGINGSLEISGCITNAYNNKWYIVEYGEFVNGEWKEQSAFVYGPSIDENYTKKYSVTYQNVEQKLAAAINTSSKTVSSGGIQKPTTTNTNKNNGVTSKNISVNWTKFPEQINVGDSYGLRGTISSNYPIYYVSAMLLDESGNGVIPNIDFSAGGVKTINITASQIINAKMYFNRIKTGGNYRVRIVVNCNSNGSQDGIWYQDYWFTVKGDEAPAPAPTISSQNIEEGQKAVLKCNDGMTIHYKVNGGNEETCSNGKTVDFKTEGSYNIEAWTTGSGYVSSPHIYKTISVSKVKTPIIGDVVYGVDEATVAITGNGTINYTIDGSNPTKDSSEYARVISLYGNTTIKALASQYGKQNSDIASKTLTVSKPDVPSGLALYNTKTKIAQGKTATVEWNAAERAASYTAKLYYNGEYTGKKYETRGTKASFALSNVGTYTIKVSATNSIGTSAESSAITVESMAPVTVTFVDRILREGKVDDSVVAQIQENVNNRYKDDAWKIEGNVLSVQKIDYDTIPSIPLWEDKPGLSRQYWSKEATREVTEDSIFYAYYSVRSYSVEFWNKWRFYAEENSRIGEVQNILYSFSATAPTDITAPIGYVLSGWSVDSKVSECYDFTFVEGNMKLDTVYTWKNKDLPVVLEIVSAKRSNTCTSYDVNLKYINWNLDATQARIIVTLYTTDGKVVDVGVKDVDLPTLGTGKYVPDTVTVNYPNQVAKISAVMVYVDGDKTGGAVSEMKYTTNIEMPNDTTYWTKWSDWSTDKPETEPAEDSNGISGVYRAIEDKMQYSYSDKDTETSSASSLSGWTKYDTKITSYKDEQGPVYSDPSGNSRKVRKEKYVTSSNYKNIYNYFRYAANRTGGNGRTKPINGDTYYEYNFDKELPRYTGNYGYKWQWGSGEDWNTVWRVDYIGKDYITKQKVSDNYGTRWYYQDPVYTYYYYKWTDWSAWQDTPVTAIADKKEVKTQKVWRYRDQFNTYQGYDPTRDSKIMEETKQTYPISGNISGLEKDYNGKIATILVYKKTNTDPTQEQLEYVAQTTIGANNSYSFTVNPKDEINYYDTGDFVVTLSIEGCDKLVNVDVIKAPVPQCTVTFQNDDGTVLTYEDGTEVKPKIDKGGSIDVNTIPIPEKIGHRFLKWDTPLININNDITVSPIYEKELYNVVFVDYENKTAEMVEMYYGDHVDLPEVADVEGMKFVGWDLQSYQFSADGDVDTKIFTVKEESPYYRTVDDAYILVTEYDPDVHTIIDETEYYKYISETNSIITGSKIITAIWEPIKYRVEFCDFNGNVVKEQFVAHGKAATPPASVEKDGVLYGWDLTGDEWWNVTKDMSIHPCVPHTIEAPTVSEPTNNAYGSFTTELNSSVTNGKIYYAVDFEITEKDAKLFVDGKSSEEENSEEQTEAVSLMSDTADEETEPETSDETYMTIDNMIKEYTEPIELYAGSVVYAFTVDDEGNISPVAVFQYDNDDVDLGLAPNEYVPDSETPQITMPTICAKPGETVTIPVTIKNNMGINYLEIVLGYDTDSLTLESIENGDVFEDNGFSSDTRDDGSCKFIWQSESDNFNDGTLMNLTFKVNDTATESKYLLDLSVEYSGDENEEEWYFVTVPGAITDEEPGLLGDVNSDEEVDFADAIQILKFDAGFIEFEDNQLVVGDVNGDEEVDFADAIQILKFDAGFIEEFSR